MLTGHSIHSAGSVLFFPEQHIHTGVWLCSTRSHPCTQQNSKTVSAIATDLPHKDLECCCWWSLLVSLRIILLLTSMNFSAVKSLPVEYNWEIKWRCESSLQDYSEWRHLVSGHGLLTQISGLHRQGHLRVPALAAMPDMGYSNTVSGVWEWVLLTRGTAYQPGAVCNSQGATEPSGNHCKSG